MTATPAQAFAAWCRFLAPTEGDLSLDPTDPGNWTSGKPGVGELKGSKFGIAAASHPGIDIASLTIEAADRMRKVEYWDKVRGDEVPPSIAFVLAEAAYGSGPLVAVEQLQQVLGGINVDGDFGANTMRALEAHTAGMNADAYGLDPLEEFLAAFSSRRLLFEASLPIWSIDKGGWTARLFRGLLIARSLA